MKVQIVSPVSNENLLKKAEENPDVLFFQYCFSTKTWFCYWKRPGDKQAHVQEMRDEGIVAILSRLSENKEEALPSQMQQLKEATLILEQLTLPAFSLLTEKQTISESQKESLYVGVSADLSDAEKDYYRGNKSHPADEDYFQGVRYREGYGIPIDQVKSEQFFKKAAAQGHIRALYYLLSDLLRPVISDGRNSLLLRQRFIKVLSSLDDTQTDAWAAYALGYSYEHKGVCQNKIAAEIIFKAAFPLFYTKAVGDEGLRDAQNRLGDMCRRGWGVIQDGKVAVSWYQKAAEQGYAVAQCNLGVCYANGQGVIQDDKAAASWFQKAAEQGHVVAQYNLGVCCYNGQGMVQDYRAAASWFQKVAEQGQAAAQYNLGVCYANGQGVIQDDKAATSWFQKAAEQGQAVAQYNLGICCYNGQGMVRDHRAAAGWFQKAAEQGHVVAQYNLGICCYNGQGMLQDHRAAASWFQKAAEQGYVKAKNALKELLKVDSPLGSYRVGFFANTGRENGVTRTPREYIRKSSAARRAKAPIIGMKRKRKKWKPALVVKRFN